MASEVPLTVKVFIARVIVAPLDQLHQTLLSFSWNFGECQFHHWLPLFKQFISYFEKYIETRSDLRLEEDLPDPPFPRDGVLQILHVIRVIFDNCRNHSDTSCQQHLSQLQQHLSLLLASSDPDVVEACLQTLAAFVKKRMLTEDDASLNSKLRSLASPWFWLHGHDPGLKSYATDNDCDMDSHPFGIDRHFLVYDAPPRNMLRGIDVPQVSRLPEPDLVLLNNLVGEFKVPPSDRFALLTRLRFARAFPSLTARQQYTCIHLYAFIVLAQASGYSSVYVTQEFVQELLTLVSYEGTVPEKIRILCSLSLVALSQIQKWQDFVVTEVTYGVHPGLLFGKMKEVIDSIIRNNSNWSLAFAEALLSLVEVLVPLQRFRSAMQGSDLIQTILHLINDCEPQHLHLVRTAVHILVALDYRIPGHLDATIARLELEVDSNGGVSHAPGGSRNHPDTEQLPYSEALILYHRKKLVKALLVAINSTYACDKTNGSEVRLLECLCTIFRRAKDFGGGVVSEAASIMCFLIDPTCVSALVSARLTSAFLDGISDEIICSAKAIKSIPKCLAALCLNDSGLHAVKDRNALRCFVKIFTSSSYLRALTDDTTDYFSEWLYELFTKHSSLHTCGVDMLIEILDTLLSIGDRMDAPTSRSVDVPTDAAPVSIEIDVEEKSLPVSDELSLCASNVARLFASVFQNAEVCSLFVEKKGIDAVLKLFSLPLMPLPTSLGQNVSHAFKLFFPVFSDHLARKVCSWLMKHLKKTNDLLRFTGGTLLLDLEAAKKTELLRSLSCLEGMFSLSKVLFEGTVSVILELSADVLEELSTTYKHIILQMALCNKIKEEKKKSVDLLDQILCKLNCKVRGFFLNLVMGFTFGSTLGIDGASLGSASKTLGTALAEVFFEALNFQQEPGISLWVKSQYFGKVVEDIVSVTYDTKRMICFPAMVKVFYVNGTFKKAIKVIGATSQSLLKVPFSTPAQNEKPSERNMFSRVADTLANFCRALDCFVNSTYLLSPGSQLLVQPASVRDLQAQVLDVILPIWNDSRFPSWNPKLVASATSLVTHIYAGVVDARQVNPEDYVHVDEELAEELAQAIELSSETLSETPIVVDIEKPVDVPQEEAEPREPLVDDVIAVSLKLLQSDISKDSVLMDLFVTLCRRNKGEDQRKIVSDLIQQLKDNGLPPLAFRRVFEVLTYLATNHSPVADMFFDSSLFTQFSSSKPFVCEGKGKEKVSPVIPLFVFLDLLNLRQTMEKGSHLALVMGLLQVVVCTAASRIEGWSPSPGIVGEAELSIARSTNCAEIHNIFLQLPQEDLRILCTLLGKEGLSEIYSSVGEVLKKLAAVDVTHRKFFMKELSEVASDLSTSTISELATLSNTQKMGHSTGSTAGASVASVVRVLQVLISLSEQDEDNILQSLNVALDPLWQELSQYISILDDIAATTTLSPEDHVLGISPPFPISPGTQMLLLPLIEAFFVLCEKIQTLSILQQDHANVMVGEVKESSAHCSSSKTSVDSQKNTGGSVTFAKFVEKHRRLLNSFVRQNLSLLEKSLSLMLKAPSLIDFDNKQAYFRSRIRHQHDQHNSSTLSISVRRDSLLQASCNQLHMCSSEDLKGRLKVHFEEEEGIDDGGLTREWYRLITRVIFDKGALLFTTVGNDATFQPNPNSVIHTDHLLYFKFVGRVVAKGLFDGQLLNVYFTRSFIKHILGVEVTYHDFETMDPLYYKSLKYILETDDASELDLTFSVDADVEKHIVFGKKEVDYELKPGGRNIPVTEETKEEYVDLLAAHILTNTIQLQIDEFLKGFYELIPREFVSIFDVDEFQLLISGLPDIDVNVLKENTDYIDYTVGDNVIQWLWEVVESLGKEEIRKFLQFVTGLSKPPLEGFSGPQRLKIQKAYEDSDRLPTASTCVYQLNLPEYTSKQQLKERLLIAIHEGSEGFGFA